MSEKNPVGLITSGFQPVSACVRHSIKPSSTCPGVQDIPFCVHMASLVVLKSWEGFVRYGSLV